LSVIKIILIFSFYKGLGHVKLVFTMFYYPNIDPVLWHITDALQVRWYGFLYVVGFFMAWVLLRYRTKSLPGWESVDAINDLFFYSMIGVLVGGRLGYTLFYDFAKWIADPFTVFYVKMGGMSFHGGLLGVIIAVTYFCHKNNLHFFSLTDKLVQVVPLGLGAGRVGNFINGELWGCTTQVPWAMVFPHVDFNPRHPAQLYAVLLEGALLFSILWLYSRAPRKTGQMTGLFLVGYAGIRLFEELFRQPDPQYGYLALGWVTMGQLLCVPMLIVGFVLLSKKERPVCINT
jgi:phosphatidylglycerol:prolipoprotein diacylglycerol transferase